MGVCSSNPPSPTSSSPRSCSPGALEGSREKRNAIVCVTLTEKITRDAALKIEMPHSLTRWRK
jgi:hypothetical protein